MEKLAGNEVLVKSLKVFTECLGTKKTKTDLMISFTKDKEEFEFVDVFLNKEQVEELIKQLNKINGTN